MRNLKKTYRTIRDNIKTKRRNGKVPWEHYYALTDIFDDDETSSSYNNAEIVYDPVNQSFETISSAIEPPQSTEPTKIKEEDIKKKDIYDIKKKMLMAEKSRTAAVNRLANSIEKNNEIQEEKNRILDAFFQFLRNNHT